MKSERHYWFAGSLVLLIAMVFTQTAASHKPQFSKWSPQLHIPEYKIFTEEPPFLVADHNKVVHAFNSQPFELDTQGSPQAVFYRQWTLEGGWTNPIDIIINPDGGTLELLGVSLDDRGVVHLVIQMNNESIYYSQAPLINAGRAASWSQLQLIGEKALAVTKGINYTAAISGDGEGRLVVIYSGRLEGNGLYASYSQDNGDTWSEPVPLYLTNNDDLIVVTPQIYMGESGLLHAVWSTFKADGSGGPGYYANLDVRSMEWSEPVELDVPGIRTPSVVDIGGEVFVSYYHHNVNGNWWRKSADAGKTWTDPARMSPIHKGTNGSVSFVADSNNVLHALFGERIDDNSHGMWHTVWSGSGWSPPEAVVRGLQVRDEIGGKGFDPRSARAIVVNGNLLLVTWGTDGAAGENGAWYSYTTLDSPELPVVPLPILAATPMPTLASATTYSQEVTPLPARQVYAGYSGQDSTERRQDPITPLGIGLIPVILLIVIVIGIRQFTSAGTRD